MGKISMSMSENIRAGEELMTDKGYEISTHEKQAEFARKRNYAFQTYKTVEQQETEAILHMARAMQELEIQLSLANERVRQLESQVYGGSTK